MKYRIEEKIRENGDAEFTPEQSEDNGVTWRSMKWSGMSPLKTLQEAKDYIKTYIGYRIKEKKYHNYD